MRALVCGQSGEFAMYDEQEKAEEDEEAAVHKLTPEERTGIALHAFRAWRKLTVAARDAALAERGFLRHADQPSDCVLTTAAAPLLLSLPRALRILHKRPAPPPMPPSPPALATFKAKLASLTLDLRHATPAEQQAPDSRSALRDKLELLTQDLSDAQAASPPSLAEQLRALTHESPGTRRRVDAPDNLLDCDSGTTASSNEAADDEAARQPADRRCSRSSTIGRSSTIVKTVNSKLDVERVWTTLLALSVLQRFSECCLFSDEDDLIELTIVDGALLWLEAHAAAHPALAAALEDGSLQRRASNLTARWQAVLGKRVEEIRSADSIVSHLSLSHLQRTSTEIAHALISRHGALKQRLARSEPTDPC
jgi:hypothetical protein